MCPRREVPPLGEQRIALLPLFHQHDVGLRVPRHTPSASGPGGGGRDTTNERMNGQIDWLVGWLVT